MNKEMHQKRELTAAELDEVVGGKGKNNHSSTLAEIGRALIKAVSEAELGAQVHHIM